MTNNLYKNVLLKKYQLHYTAYVPYPSDMIPVWFGAMGVMIGFIFVVWVSKVHQKESGYARSVPQEKIFDLDLTHMHTSVNVIDIDSRSIST